MSMRSGSQGLRRVSAAGSVVFAVCLALAPGLGRAALKTKAGTGTDLTVAGSWDALPGSGDVAAWTNTSLCAGLTLPGDVSWGGLLVAGALTDIDITGSGTLTSGASGIDLSASAVNLSLGTPVALAANQTWSVTNNRTLAVGGAVSGAYGLTKAGVGAVSLTSSNNAWTGSTVVNAGTLNLSGGFGGAIGTVSSVLGVGFASGTTGAVAVIGGGTFAATKLMVGYTGGSGNTTQGNGWLIVTNGAINVTNTANYFVIGGEEANPANGTLGVGQVDLSGNGTINFSPKTVSDIEMGTRGGRGVLNVGGNATLTGNHLQLGLGGGTASTNARVYVTQSGGTVALSDNTGLLFNNRMGGALTVYNLNGGVLKTKVIACSVSPVGSIFNFNGGTLKADANVTNFMGGLNSAVIYAGGATIDDGGFAITNSQALAAPTLYGLGPVGTTLAPTVAGTGYTTPPNVTFSTPSGGVPATGCAELNADGTIKDIAITSPGSGYASGQSVTVTLVGGGGGTGAAFAGLTASVASIGGGLTKTGNGTLTLSGANTYTGGTTNSAGVLRLGLATALPVGQTLTVNGGTVDLQNHNVTIGSLSGTGGGIAVGGSLTVTQGADAAYGGVIAGTGTVIKAGAATLTLAGCMNTCSGTLVVSEGTLKLQRKFSVVARDWNAASLAGSNGSAISAWTDTVAGKKATTYGSAPTLVTGDSALGGRPAVNFNGSGQALKVLAADSSINTNAGCNVNAFTLAVVFKPTANGGTSANRAEWWNGSGIVSAEQANNTTDWALAYNTTTVQAGLGQGSGGADTGLLAFDNSATNVGHIAIYSWDKATGMIVLNVDGATTTTNNATTTRGVYDFAIGRNSPGGYGNYFQGNIAEIQFFTNGLTGAEIDNVGYTLAQTYGVSTAYANNRDANLSADAALSIAAGGTLDLNGMRQTVSRLQGGGTVSNGTLTVAGMLAPGGLQTVGTLAVENLGFAENATYDWNYGDATADLVRVTGTLALPTAATVAVSRVAGSTAALSDRRVLFTCTSGAISAGDLSGWTVTGVQTGAHVKVSGNQVVLVLPRGTLIRVQ